MCQGVGVHVEVRGPPGESVLSLHHVGPGDGTPVISLDVSAFTR